jgi:hypothetical protein
MSKTITAALSTLVVLLVIYFLWGPTPYTSTQSEALSSGFEAFKKTFREKDGGAANLDKVEKIIIAKGKARAVELKKAGKDWVVASSFGYPADKERVEKILKALGEIREGKEAGESSASHEDFEVDKKKGGFVALYGSDGKELVKIVVGKNAQSRDFSANRAYMRFGDEAITYVVNSDIRSELLLYSKDVEAKNYILKDIVKIPEDSEVQTVRVVRPEKADLLLERKSREIPVEKPKEEKKEGEEAKDSKELAVPEKAEKQETKKEEYYVVTSGNETKEIGKSEEWSAKSLLNQSGKSVLSVDEPVEPKDLAEYGLDKPQLKVVLSYRKKDSPEAELKSVSFLFGNAKKDEKANSKYYHFQLEGEENKGRIYLVQDYKFDRYNKEMKDFLPKPKEEPKAEVKPEAPKADAGANPATPASSPPTPTPTPPAPPAGQAQDQGGAPKDAAKPAEKAAEKP